MLCKCIFCSKTKRILPPGGHEDVHTWDKSAHLAQAYSRLGYRICLRASAVFDAILSSPIKSSQLVGSYVAFLSASVFFAKILGTKGNYTG